MTASNETSINNQLSSILALQTKNNELQVTTAVLEKKEKSLRLKNKVWNAISYIFEKNIALGGCLVLIPLKDWDWNIFLGSCALVAVIYPIARLEILVKSMKAKAAILKDSMETATQIMKLRTEQIDLATQTAQKLKAVLDDVKKEKENKPSIDQKNAVVAEKDENKPGLENHKVKVVSLPKSSARFMVVVACSIVVAATAVLSYNFSKKFFVG